MENWLGNRQEKGRGVREIVSMEISCAILGLSFWIESCANAARN